MFEGGWLGLQRHHALPFSLLQVRHASPDRCALSARNDYV